MITNAKEYECQCDEKCGRPLSIRIYGKGKIEFEIDGNAVVLDTYQIGHLWRDMGKFLIKLEQDEIEKNHD